MPAGEYDLAVTVAPAFPLALAGVYVETRQDSFIQTIHVAIMKNRAVELVLHVDVFPDGRRGEAVSASLHLHQRGSLAVTRRNEETVLIDHHRLRNVDAHVRVPRITPQQRAVLRREPDNSRRAHNHDLPAPSEI